MSPKQQQPPKTTPSLQRDLARLDRSGLMIDRSIAGPPGSPSSQRLLLRVAWLFRLLSLSPSVTRALITHPSPALPTRRTTGGGDDDDGDDDDDDVDDREVGGELARDDTRVTVDDESSRSDEEILGGRQAGWLAAGGTRGGSPGGERETEDEGEGEREIDRESERGRAAVGADDLSREEEGTSASASVLRRGRGPDDERVVPEAERERETGEPRARIQMLTAGADRRCRREMFAVTPDRESRASSLSSSLSFLRFRFSLLVISARSERIT